MKTFARLYILALSSVGLVQGGQLIGNGGFETGNFSNWTITNQSGGSGNFFVSSSTTTPLSSSATVGPESGTYYAVSDSLGPGTHIISQNFTVTAPVSSVTLSFVMFVDSPSPGTVGGQLDYNSIPNQYARVDILSSTASLFSTTTGDLRTFYEGTDSLTKSAYRDYSFDITSLVGDGGNFTLRFAEVNNVDILNMGIDDVSILATAAPEPSSMALMGLGVLGLITAARKRFAS